MPELKIYGEIMPGMAAEVKQVLAAAEPGEELLVRIDSEGGSVFEGFSIYDAISAYQGPKRSVIESAAFSIASLIALACDEIEITANGYMMIHNPYAMVEGDDSELARKSDLLSKLKATMAKVYQSRTGRSEDEVLRMMKDESFFDATEAKSVGLVDTVLARRKETQATITHVKNLPQSVIAALWKGGREEVTPKPIKEMPDMAEPTKVPATIAQIKKLYPKASADFLVRAMEEEMSMEEVGAAMLKALQAENEELKAKVSAMEEEKMARAQEEEEETEEPEEEMAKAKSGVKPVATGTQPTQSATARWKQAVRKYVEQGHANAKAVQLANKANPGLRAQYLAEVNA